MKYGKSIYSLGHKVHSWKIDEKYVCTATHPKTPNYSGHSRGRKIHLAEKHQKGTLTVCNMKVDQIIPVEEGDLGPELTSIWTPVMNGRCAVCFNA